MNIALIIRRFDFGGAENYVRELANVLADNGNVVFVFAANGRQRNLLSPKVIFQHVNLSKWLLPFNLLLLLPHLKKHKIEIIHAQQPSAIRVGALLGPILGIPVIVTIHSTTPLELKTEFTRKILARIFYISRHTMERSAWYSQLRPKCRYIPNGMMPRQYQEPQKTAQLIYCSRMDKTHASLLKLLITEVVPVLKSKIPTLVFEIYGDGHWFKQVEMWAHTINIQLGSDTVFLGGFTTQFSSNGFLVIGVGRVALDALSAGIPVLAINAKRCGPRISSANYEILSQNNFVDITAQMPNAELIIKSIIEIYTHHSEIVIDSLQLWDTVNKEFCLSSIVYKIQQEYREAVHELNIQRMEQKTHNINMHPTRNPRSFSA